MREFLKKLMEIILIGSAIIGVIFPIGGLIYYALALEGRVAKLEKQVDLLAVGPSMPSGDASSGATAPASPIITACLGLVDRAAKAHENKDVSLYVSLD